MQVQGWSLGACHAHGDSCCGQGWASTSSGAFQLMLYGAENPAYRLSAVIQSVIASIDLSNLKGRSSEIVQVTWAILPRISVLKVESATTVPGGVSSD